MEIDDLRFGNRESGLPYLIRAIDPHSSSPNRASSSGLELKIAFMPIFFELRNEVEIHSGAEFAAFRTFGASTFLRVSRQRLDFSGRRES